MRIYARFLLATAVLVLLSFSDFGFRARREQVLALPGG